MILSSPLGLVRPVESFFDRPCLRPSAGRNGIPDFCFHQGLCISSGQHQLSDVQWLVQRGSADLNKERKRRSGLLRSNSEFLGHGVEALVQSQRPLFKDQGHAQYYGAGVARCGKTGKEAKQAKKAARKLGKRPAAEGMVAETETLPEYTAEVAPEMDEKAMFRQVLKELEKVTSELKALRKAQEKAAAKCKDSSSSSSSSSSSESSDSEMEAEDMRKTRATRQAPMQVQDSMMPSPQVVPSSGFVEADAFAAELRAFIEKGSIHPPGSSLPAIFRPQTIQSVAPLNSSSSLANTHAISATVGGSVEVCMSGKCRRDHGAQQLLAAFQSRMPAGSAVSASSCKCLGKCGKGANVRVRPDETNPTVLSYVETQDVPAILARHFGAAPSARPLPSLQQTARQPSRAAV